MPAPPQGQLEGFIGAPLLPLDCMWSCSCNFSLEVHSSTLTVCTVQEHAQIFQIAVTWVTTRKGGVHTKPMHSASARLL